MTAPTILLQRSDGPRRSLLPVLIVLLVGSLALAIAIEQWRIATVRRYAAVAALSASNVAAERDTTRDAGAGNPVVERVLGDSVRLFERRVTQVAQRRDALDAALRTERAARYDLSTVVDSLRRSLAAVTTDDSTHRARFADFDLRQAPYTVGAHVEVPAPPDSARIILRIALDSIDITARVECSSPDAGGARTALLEAAVPRWARVRLRRVEQSPDVCASPAPRERVASPRVRFAPMMVGAGRFFAGSGPSGWALFVGIGLTL